MNRSKLQTLTPFGGWIQAIPNRHQPSMSELLVIPALLFAFFSVSSSAATLNLSQPLISDGQILISTNGTFALGFFKPFNSSNRYVGIWYNGISSINNTVVWVANRRNPIPHSNGTFSLTADGSLRISDRNSTIFWSSPSASKTFANPMAQLLDTGNLIVVEEAADPNAGLLWQSFDHPTNTLLPGMKLGSNLKTGLSRNLTSWLSPSDPSPGNYTMAIDIRGVPQLVTTGAGSIWLWRGGTWNGFGFTGAGPDQFYDIGLYRQFTSVFNITEEEIYYCFNMIGNAISRVTLEPDGMAKRYEWVASSGKWNIDWFAPRDACDHMSECGANGVCNWSNSPNICSCLDGFVARNPANWGRQNWKDGCVTRTPLECGANGTNDEFALVRGAKLPDTAAATVDMSLDLDGCRSRCSTNCSCRAYASADLSRGGRGCILWTAEIEDLRVYDSGGQDLYVRSLLSQNGSKRKSWVFAVAAVAIVLFLLFISLCIFMVWKHRQGATSPKRGDEMMRELEGGQEVNSDLSLFQFTQILDATNNFSNENKLGEGGFGPVYKGKLLGGQDVAIKRLSARSGQGLEEFKNEILLIANLQHRNLVKLLGCCIHGEEKMLLYEYMPNKSLDLFLFDQEQGSKLEWSRRFQIIDGVAQGLLYLHKHSRLRVVHRDLKASNILLDADMNPKISDFGMARIFTANEAQAITRRIMGTFGYISPEYAFKGLFSVKSDVFSFGVLLLEIVSGKRNAGFHEFGSSSNLLAYAWELWKEGTWMELVDPALGGQFRHDEVARSIYVALLCVQEGPEDRPVMSEVVAMFGNENLVFNSPKQPAFFSMKIASNADWAPFNAHSFNDLSFSIVTGR
ncbi:Receptor-like serine/threonine-protein kinase SD1-8 [Apostasia shenzhenica]|uniref:Receptor-like serine/threonine-protein kinase n=1 Tax=Apostasia shenzhenica TaxID=1088818 RepID=A0A2I0AAT8_9ASPA|nr:Receptor-like serine/threonine-protein kinase SD1-8 [Apostasia shenzhenica]